jgi:hypothetical protein
VELGLVLYLFCWYSRANATVANARVSVSKLSVIGVSRIPQGV